VNKVQEELWGAAPYPPRTIMEVHRLNQDDIVEIAGTFLRADREEPQKVTLASRIPGATSHAKGDPSQLPNIQ
jgi:hypothetical protein